jgi:hypothetical protein
VKMKYAVGDPCWIDMTSYGEARRVKGRVVLVAQLPHLPNEIYMIELEDRAEFMHPECRDATQMSDHPDYAPPIARLLRETTPPVDATAIIKSKFS